MKPMPKLLAAGAAILALAGTAALAETTHHLTIALPGGGQERIEYTGDVAPTVRFLAPEMVRSQSAFGSAGLWSPFADLERMSFDMDRMAAEMDRQMDAALRQARQLAAMPGAPELDSATLKSLPAGTQSYSVTTISTGKGFCTRSVRISAGEGAKPQVVSQTSGDCGPAAGNAQSKAISAPLPADTAPRRHI